MSESDINEEPDIQPEYTTVDFRKEGRPSVNVSDDFVSETRSILSADDEGFGKGQESGSKFIPEPMPRPSIRPRKQPEPRKPRKDRRTSLIWTKFTIISKKDQIASCNICDQKLSIKSTSNNLKKHLERKHGYSIQLGSFPFKVT